MTEKAPRVLFTVCPRCQGHQVLEVGRASIEGGVLNLERCPDCKETPGRRPGFEPPV